MKRVVAAFCTLFAVAASASAEVVVPLRQNGPPENRVGMTIVGDGYTQAELLKYSTDADLLVQALFAESPWSAYATYFNVYRVDVVSNESGADHPERGVLRDTALGSNYNCGGIQRLICVDFGAVNAALSRSVPATSRDIVIVLVNDTEYGGSGGAFAVASTHRDAAELVLHESGHSFGLLTDEYSTSPPPCSNTLEPPEANAAKEIGRDQIKWAKWVEAATSLPTSMAASGVVGAFEGSRYCATGLYRPTFNSKMRSLNRPYEQVNSEQLIRRIYNFVSPIETASPAQSTVTSTGGASVEFSVVTPQPPGHDLAVTWTLDGTVVGRDRSLRLAAGQVAGGTHAVEVEVTDPTGAVRADPNGVLRARHAWTLRVEVNMDDLKRALLELVKRWRGLV